MWDPHKDRYIDQRWNYIVQIIFINFLQYKVIEIDRLMFTPNTNSCHRLLLLRTTSNINVS